MARNRSDDDLAYGSYYGQDQHEGEGADRGFIGDVGKRLFGGAGRRQDQPVSASPLYAWPGYHLGPTLSRCTPAVASVPCRMGCRASQAPQLVVTALKPYLSLSIIFPSLSSPTSPQIFSTDC